MRVVVEHVEAGLQTDGLEGLRAGGPQLQFLHLEVEQGGFQLVVGEGVQLH
jgi:hypothetical protein